MAIKRTVVGKSEQMSSPQPDGSASLDLKVPRPQRPSLSVDMDETHNLGELLSFLQTNQQQTLVGRIRRYAFTALVTYCWSSNTARFKAEVTVETGYRSGKVTMMENDRCPSDKFHLDFQPNYQAMHFNRDANMLVISGASLKMAGAYKVSISALAPVG